MTDIEQRFVDAGAELRAVADQRAGTMGDTGRVVSAARRRGRLRAAGAVVGLVVLVVGAGSLLSPAGIVVDPVAREVTAWSGASVEVPAGWQVASETLMPNGPPEQFVASTSDLPVGGDRCAQTPEAALEQLGPTDALVVVQRLHPVQPDDPTLGTLERWPEDVRNQTTLRACPSNGDQLDMYWFHTQLDGEGYWVLGAFGARASDQRRAEGLAILNSFQPAPTGTATEADTVVVPDVRGRTLAQARARLQRRGLEAAVVSGAGVQDPDHPDAVVAAQEPPANTTVARQATVGLRTAEVSPQLCDVLTRLPARDGDATDLANTDGYPAMLDDARSHAGPVLDEAIEQLLDHHDSGQPFAQAPAPALDVAAVHHDACHRRAELGQRLPQPDGWEWSQLPDGPVDGRHGAAVVWADDQLVVWGGEVRQDVPADDGAVYDPATDTWTPTAESPLGPQARHVSVWTGEQVILCCAQTTPTTVRAAAYDPTADTWERLPDPPLPGAARATTATMIGDLVVVLGETTSGEQAGTAVAYDTTTGSWRDLQPPPGPVTFNASASVVESDVYVWMAPHGRATVYDAESDTWLWLPEPPAFPQQADTVWTGSEWLVIGSNQDQLVAIAYDPATSTWRQLDVPLPRADGFEGNLGSQAAVWTGGRLLIYTGALGSGLADPDNPAMLAYQPNTDQWERLPDAPTPAYNPPLLWAGTETIIYTDPIRTLHPPEP